MTTKSRPPHFRVPACPLFIQNSVYEKNVSSVDTSD